MLRKICFLIIILQLVALPLYAQDDNPEQNPLRKLARGTVNVSLGWTEIVHQMILVYRDKGHIGGLFLGPLKGLAFAVARTVTGAFEVITFLIPPQETLIEPEFIFE